MSENYLIGKDNQLPWKISAEMKYFSQITFNSIVIMGAKTFASIGKPLKNRHNIVITRNKERYKDWKEKNLVFTSDLEKILQPYKENSHKHVFVMGGLEIYQQTYSAADYYYVSLVKGNYQGNVFFPFKDWNQGKLIKKEEFPEFTTYIYQNLCRKEKNI